MKLHTAAVIGLLVVMSPTLAAPHSRHLWDSADTTLEHTDTNSFDTRALAADTSGSINLEELQEAGQLETRNPARKWVFNAAKNLAGTVQSLVVGTMVSKVAEKIGIDRPITQAVDTVYEYAEDAFDKARERFKGACSTPEPGKPPTCIMPSNEHVPLTSEIIKAIQNAKPECQKQAALNVAAPKFPLTAGAPKSRRGLRDTTIKGALADDDDDTEDDTDTADDDDAMCPPAVFQTENGAALCLGPFKTPKACAKFAKSVLKDSFGGKDAGEATKTRTKPKGLAAATSKLKSSAKSAKALKKKPAKKPAVDSEADA